MKLSLHNYQKRAVETLLSHQGAGLFLDPGLGKSIVALTAFNEIWKASDGQAKMLVVTPIQPMLSTWGQEIKKWDDTKHLTYTILHGPKKRMRLNDDVDVYLVNPETIPWLFEQKGRPRWQVLCVDESHRWKSTTGVRFKALKWHLKMFQFRWILTGTPAPNGLLDLFGQSYILDQGEALGKYVTNYRRKYFYQTGFRGYVWMPHEDAMERIAAKLEDHTLQLSGEDYLDLPEVMTIDRLVDIGTAMEHVYKPMQREFYLQLEKADIVAPNAAAAGGKCRQIANGCVYDVDRQAHVIHDAKLEALATIMEETVGHPLLVLYEFRHDRDRILKLLGNEALCITGMDGPLLKAVVEQFNDGKIPYMVAHPGSLAGMNIQGACYHMVWYSLTWSLEHYIQSIGRLYRQGQVSKIVFVYRLLAQDTIDEDVAYALNGKALTQDKLNEAISRRRT